MATIAAAAAANKTTSAAIQHYTRRAPTYDESHSGWHIDLGHDYVKWLTPLLPPDCCYALDLACGTGLVTIPLAEAIGLSSGGKVIGVDATAAMLAEAKKKDLKNAAEIVWLEADITSYADLDGLKEVRRGVGIDGSPRDDGFDVISCCSALVLLRDPREALKKWAGLLRKGGYLIVDTPTEHPSLLRLFTQELRLTAGLNRDFDWTWITSRDSVEGLLQNAGLEIVQTRVRDASRGGGGGRVWSAGEWEEVFESEFAKHSDFLGIDESRKEEVRRVFKRHWDERVRDDSEGKFRDHPRIYVVIARKV